ncbi:TIGR02680 family protein [Desulfitobacterium hafniense]|uniref:TIGR02680 family protein n=1 Tax=Desulfitobacterium hafniense TaxID=49338 RepID=UPI00036E1026|nr:TIGR02680 family protein [Desulfitobacterium hafniense]
MGRWQMKRAGVLNFWYYDEEEFLFEEGRLILRGTNGSGKSVTMQSFIPLVLDGDKRPERLDPFGSRDRRLEYYLLGEADQGHTDRTGYLWLEFYHPEKELYKSVGIGLRARRGVPQLGFWGFLIDDGRRIGQDFHLYDYPLWLEQGKKVPLNRKNLEEKIASGGQVVQEQATYRDLVNKALFGFRESESYKDLLKLLLELRSPKLSKDFKPSSIYEILTNALPPLLEEELGSLSDLLEDMDQITDHLEELQDHLKELQKIEKVYDTYNRFLLKKHSAQVLELGDKYDHFTNQVSVYETRLAELEKQQQDIQQLLETSKQRLTTVEAELEILNRSEAMEKQRELELLEDQVKGIDKRLSGMKERIESNQQRLIKMGQEIAATEERLKVLTLEQIETLSRLEDSARITEFREHDIYHGIWLRGIPQEGQWPKPWLQDLDNHRQKLAVAYQTAQEEGEAARAAAEAELKWGEICKERASVEVEQEAQRENLEVIKETIRENLVQWQQNLEQIAINGEQLREILQALTEISAKNRFYEPVRRPALQAYEQKKESFMEQALHWQQQRQSLLDERRSLEKELEEWEQTREPEPRRTEGRSLSRQGRAKGTGAPLFAVCEFASSLDEKGQAQLEETLEQAGLLDAWIFPGGQVTILDQEQGEEIWIEPEYVVQGETLASVLSPTPSQESGLNEEDIRRALNCFGWLSSGKSSSEKRKASSIYLTGEGYYQLGPLAGVNSSKPRAEYIGKETRLRTKQLMIARIEGEIKGLIKEIAEVDENIAALNQQRQVMEKEMATFPHDKDLQAQLDVLLEWSYRLNEIMNQEQKVETWYKQRVGLWRDLQVRLVEQTVEWSGLKKERQLREAVELCGSYRSDVSELSSLWARYQETSKYMENQKQQHLDLQGMVEEDEEERLELEEQKGKHSIQINQLLKLMAEMDIEEVHRQIKEGKAEKVSLNKAIEELYKEQTEQGKELGRVITELSNNRESFADSRKNLDEEIKRWSEETQLGLIPQWKEVFAYAADDSHIRQVCKQIIKELSSMFQNTKEEQINRNLYEEFNKSQANLRDYMLEIDNLDSGRLIITSKRDRLNPLPPSKLLDELTELENEQRILLTARDRELYEEIIIGSVGKAIRSRIHRARDWTVRMDGLMKQRNTSSGLKLSLKWIPLGQKTENELDTQTLIELLMRDAERMDDEEFEKILTHFRTRILKAKQEAQEEKESLRRYIYQMLDYRAWFEFKLEHRKGDQSNYTELTDSKFNVLSGGEKAMAMYIPLFAAAYSRYSDANPDAPKIISLDEAFAGVDDANMRDMFQLLTDMGFDYMMTSQVLWGCYDTVPSLAIYEIYRPRDADAITLFHYRWNGKTRSLIE